MFGDDLFQALIHEDSEKIMKIWSSKTDGDFLSEKECQYVFIWATNAGIAGIMQELVSLGEEIFETDEEGCNLVWGKRTRWERRTYKKLFAEKLHGLMVTDEQNKALELWRSRTHDDILPINLPNFLYLAVDFGHAAIVKDLIWEMGVDPCKRYRDDNDEEYCLVNVARNLDVVKVLLGAPNCHGGYMGKYYFYRIHLCRPSVFE